MQLCTACGRESPDGFLHCGFCGASLSGPAVERRKLATLVFCDMSGSTAMGERVDAETVRGLMLSYFHEMRGALERHGGTVEKFIGDAVVAVFGVPEAHEDDALRACRAALEMQARLAALNEELERRYGTRVALRIGVNTGEVVAGDPSSRETFVTGDAVNVAARLEQAAAPGEVLLGEPTYRLVREAVTVEAVEPLSAKGKSEPVPAYRLLAVSGPGPLPRRAGSALVGREAELALLELEFDAVVAERRCRLTTVVGEPGVGKSRLAAELLDRVGARARAVRGGCLSYGEGITYWPIAQIVRELAGIHDEHTAEQARARIDGLVEDMPNGDTIASKVAQLVGIVEGNATAPETAWAIRHFLAAEARKQPLVVLVDDIHWAEPALLDLLTGLPPAIEDAPVLLLCLARPELLEARPDWNVTVSLEPLPETDLDTLLEKLLPDAPADVRGRLAKASAGNPLFAEELVAWALEGDADATAMPTSLNALLGARLDRLEAADRDALERGAIEGELFHRGAIVELSPPDARAAVRSRLEALTGKDIVRPAAASFVGEAAYRFKHILFRDAAYGAIAKRLRAGLHEQFATWLERFAGSRIAEYEEIVGYHLEQSYRYHTELGPADDDVRALGRRAAERLGSAGRRALARGDPGATANLLQRASALLPAEGLERLELVPDLATALCDLARHADAKSLLEEANDAARQLGDERLGALMEVERAKLMLLLDPKAWMARALAEAERAVPVFERLGDDLALARTFELLCEEYGSYGRHADAAAAGERGLMHAERAVAGRQQGWLRIARMAALHHGPTPLDEVKRVMEGDLAWARQAGNLLTEAIGSLALGVVCRVTGDSLRSTELVSRGYTILADLDMHFFAVGYKGGWVWWLTDDASVAEAWCRESYEAHVAAGDHAHGSTVAANHAEALYRLGRHDEAGDALALVDETGSDLDVTNETLVRAVRAKILARRGATGEAEALAREAVALAAGTESVDLKGDSLCALGEVLQLAGRADEAAEPLREAIAVWEAKGNLVFADRPRALLAGP